MENNNITKNIIHNLSSINGMRDQLENFGKIKEEIKTSMKVEAEDSVNDALQEFVDGKELEYLQKEMTYEEARDAYEKAGATELLETIDSGKIDKEFLKDFLITIKEQSEKLTELDGLMKEMEDLMIETKETMEQLLGDTDVITFIKNEFTKVFKETTNPIQKIKSRDSIESIEDAYTLRHVISLFSAIGTENTFKEFKEKNDLYHKNIKHFATMVKNMGLHVNLDTFVDFEERFMEDKNKEFNGLFIYLLKKYYGNKRTGVKSTDGLSLVCLTIILQSLYTENIKEENKNKLLCNVSNLLNLFY